MAVKVYGAAMSTATVRVLLCLEEMGAEYELVPIDFSTGEHKSPPHVARNVSLYLWGVPLSVSLSRLMCRLV